jgi:hypothetical protein
LLLISARAEPEKPESKENKNINEMQNNNKIYYKYRSLKGDNWQYILDIFLNRRLYCAKYNELNDPMEGFYRTCENLPNYLRDHIFNQKGNYRICSLANNDNNTLLWAHYANGFAGIVVGLKNKRISSFS